MAYKPSFNPETGRVKVLVRLSYCKVFEKTKSFETGSLRYRTNGLIPKNTEEGKAQMDMVNKAIRHLVDKEWSGKDIKKFKEALGDGPKGRWPLFDGDKYLDNEGEVREGYADMKYLRLTNDKKIKLRNRRGEEMEREDAEELFKSGFWAIAFFHMYPIKDQKKGGNGIFTTLDGLQFYKRDEEFAGGGMDDDEFENLGEDEDDDLDDKPKSKKGASIDDDDDDI